MLHGSGDAASAGPAARHLHQPRHADHFVVQKEPVLLLDVIAEAFSVIGEHDDGRRVVPAALFQRVE